MSGTALVDHQALQASREDGHSNFDESDEVLLGPLEDHVQPAIAAQAGKGRAIETMGGYWGQGSAGWSLNIVGGHEDIRKTGCRFISSH
jgi:hypothetical protein